MCCDGCWLFKSVKKLALTLAVSVAAAFFLFRLTAAGVEGSPVMFTLILSVAAVIIFSFPNPLSVNRYKFAASVAAVVCCVPLSIFVVDLFYGLQGGGSIGGNGLGDAVLQSTLYAPFAALVVYSAWAYVSQTVRLIKKQQELNTNANKAT
jgi:hypothetical protein